MLKDLVRARSPVAPERTIVVGYAQGHVGYILTPEDWLTGGYEPEITFWGPLEGEYLAERLEELLPMAMAATRPDGAAGGADRFSPPRPVDDLPIDDPAPMAGTVPAALPEEVWVRSGQPADAQPPATVPRVSGIATFVWIGDDPMAHTPVVTLERETEPGSGQYEPVRRRSGRLVQEGELLLMYTPLPVRREMGEPQTHYWAAEWQAVPWVGAQEGDDDLDGLDARGAAPLGLYRFHVAGKEFSLHSDPFEVVPAVLDVVAVRDGETITVDTRLHAPKGYRLLDLQERSNTPVPLREAEVTIELTLAGGGTIEQLHTTDASGRVELSLGAQAADVTDVRVTDARDNSGAAAP
jgi:neutral ceramidase